MQITTFNPFTPTGNTINLAVTSASANSAISSATSLTAELPGTLLVVNNATQTALVQQSSLATASAQLTDVPVAPNQSLFMRQYVSAGFVSARLLGCGAGIVSIAPGQGGA